jgi:hypothetical protein
MKSLFTNIFITNKATLPKNTNLKTINGESLINDCNECVDIVISGGGGGAGSDGIIDCGERMTGSEIIDMGERV